VSRRLRWIAAVVLAAVVGWGLFVQTPPGPRSIREFDADRIASLEIDLWRAYYDKRNVRLFILLAELLREQRRYPWAKAVTEGFYLARPAARFARMKGEYDAVLPDLNTRTAWRRTGPAPATTRARWRVRSSPGGSPAANRRRAAPRTSDA